MIGPVTVLVGSVAAVAQECGSSDDGSER